MKLSSDPDHEDFHIVVHFMDNVMVNNVVVKSCVHIDTEANEAVCFVQPLKPVNGMLLTHTVPGTITYTWRKIPKGPNGSEAKQALFERLKADWEEREMLRKQEVHAI